MLIYPTITDLRAERADLGLFLRWVTERKAWYQADPIATNPDDGDSFLQATVGVGRWVKQLTRNLSTNGLTWVTITSNTSASSGFGYYCNTTSGLITLTLPATTVIGTIIKIHATVGTNILNKIIINVNGRLVNSIAGNREITRLNDFVELTYISDALGWAVTGYNEPNVLRLSTTSFTVANPVTLPNFTGIIDYLGTQKNTVSYQNPTDGANSRTIRMQTYNEGSVASGTLANLFDKNGADDNFFNGNQMPPAITFDFISGLIRPNTIQLSITNTGGRWTTRPRNIAVFGANEVLSNGQLLLVPNVGSSIQGSMYSSFNGVTRLAFLIGQDLASLWTLSGGAYHILLNIAAASYFRYIIIQYYGTNFANTNNQFMFLSEIEFFGDIVAP